MSYEPPAQSPLFHATHKDRYRRQELIKDIEDMTKRRLLVYIAEAQAPIGYDDVLPFGDLLDDVEKGEKVDLLLDSPGGDADQAEKLAYIIREKASAFRVIVADRAKSAATLIALAADEIVMGYTSELGPIDPQIRFPGPTGMQYLPATSFIDGLQRIIDEAAKSGGLSPAYYPILQNLTPAVLDLCYKSIDRAKSFAKKWLSQYMLKDHPDAAERIAETLCNTTRYQSHGMAITWREAEKEGLRVTYLEPQSNLWKAIWQLYATYRVDMRQHGLVKLYESKRISIGRDSGQIYR